MNRTIPMALLVSAMLGAAVPGLMPTETFAQSAIGIGGIRDRAKMFSAEAVTKMEAALRELEKSSRLQVLIETRESLDGKEPRDVAIANAKAARVDGLSILIAKKEGKVWTAPGPAAEGIFSRDKVRGINDAITSAFKGGQFDKGLLDAVSLIRQDAGTSTASKKEASGPVSLPGPDGPGAPAAKARPSTRADVPAPAPAPRPAPANLPEAGGGGSGLTTLFIGGGLVLLVLWGLSRMFRRPAMLAQPQGNAAMGYRPGGPVGGNYPPQGRVPGYGPSPGYGAAPGYGPMPPQGGGGGFMSGMLGGLGGAIAGNILYDKFGRPVEHHGAPHTDAGTVSHGEASPPTHSAPESAPGGQNYDPNAGAGGDWSTPAAEEEAGAGGSWGTPESDEAVTGGSWNEPEPAQEEPAGGDWGGGSDDSGGGGDWGSGDSGGSDDQGEGGSW